MCLHRIKAANGVVIDEFKDRSGHRYEKVHVKQSGGYHPRTQAPDDYKEFPLHKDAIEGVKHHNKKSEEVHKAKQEEKKRKRVDDGEDDAISEAPSEGEEQD